MEIGNDSEKCQGAGIQQKSTHIAFFDESSWSQGRYRAISMVSLEYKDYAEMNGALAEICKHKNKEIKWKNVSKGVGIDLINFTFNNLHRMRVDVLLWDIEDSRHKNVMHRDDLQNLQRLYYRLMHTIMRDRWPDGSVWNLFPDEQSGIDWCAIRSFLEQKSEHNSIEAGLYERIEFRTRKSYSTLDINQCQSQKFPFIQLADFFAGIACYSHAEFDKICLFKDEVIGQGMILDVCGLEADINTLSSRDKIRIPLVWYLANKAKKGKHSVSFSKHKGFVTLRKDNPLNFWFYMPQHDKDKAPIKKQLYKKTKINKTSNGV